MTIKSIRRGTHIANDNVLRNGMPNNDSLLGLSWSKCHQATDNMGMTAKQGLCAGE